jgi:hypothetical protein
VTAEWGYSPPCPMVGHPEMGNQTDYGNPGR